MDATGASGKALSDYLKYTGNNELVEYLIDEKDWAGISVEVKGYNEDGTSELSGTSNGVIPNLQYQFTTDAQLVIEVTVNGYTHSDRVSGPTGADKEDDRDQHVISVTAEEWSVVDEKPLGTYTDVTANTKYVANDGSDVTSWIKNFLPNYGKTMKDEDGNSYRLVYYVSGGDLEDVTSDITIKGVWTKDAKEL